MLKFAALFIALVTTQVALATPTLSLTTSPETYVPGGTVEITATVTSNIEDNVSALMFYVWLPSNITPISFIEAPDVSDFYGHADIEGAWYDLGSPRTAIVQLAIDPDTVGDVILNGQIAWRDQDDQHNQVEPLVPLTITRSVTPTRYHSADTGIETGNVPNGELDLSELLRVIQFYNSGEYRCSAGTEDGYVPGIIGSKACTPHDDDYNAQDWSISLGELLRMIQFYNVGGYHDCDDPESEDGFCTGSTTL